MGFIKFLRFLRLKLRRKRVAAVDFAGEEDDRAGCNKSSCKGGTMVMKQLLQIMSWEEIQRLTMNLSLVIGHGGFSRVYLARFPDSSTAAVKIQCCSTERLHQAYKQELEILLHLNHPNIVKLLGHFADHDREAGILILEYVPNGNLHENLHGCSSKKVTRGLSWKRRMAIAFQLAQAIEYLHDDCNIIHGDIKASNILLDEQLNCKLCDFGSSTTGFSSSSFRNNNNDNHRRSVRIMHGSPGYTDPHYLRTGVASKKNDVYGFGVIVLELITGREALNPLSGERLSIKAESLMVRDDGEREKVVAGLVDPRLMIRGDLGFDMEEAIAMTELSVTCLSDSPTHRPSLSHILASMRKKISSISIMHA